MISLDYSGPGTRWVRDFIIPKRRQGLYLVVLSGIYIGNWVVICYRSHHLQELETSVDDFLASVVKDVTPLKFNMIRYPKYIGIVEKIYICPNLHFWYLC